VSDEQTGPSNQSTHLSPSGEGLPRSSLIALSLRLSTFWRTSHDGGRVLNPLSSSLQ
jgi:hypothetical protein